MSLITINPIHIIIRTLISSSKVPEIIMSESYFGTIPTIELTRDCLS